MSRAPLVVVGDVLLDREVLGTVDRLCPEAPVPVLVESQVLDRPGGAGLAALFAAMAGRDRDNGGRSPREVVLVAAVSGDAAGDRIRELLAGAGIRLVELPLLGPTPEKIRLRSDGHLLLRLDRGDGPGAVGAAPPAAIDAIGSAGALLVSDYGRGVVSQTGVLAALGERAHCVPVVWDPHPRGGLPVPAARLVMPNRSEASGFVAAVPTGPDAHGGELAQAASMAVRLRRYWSANAVVVTLADRGAVVSDGVSPPLLVPAPFRAHGDSCGAGDRFAAAAVTALAEGLPVLDAVTAGVTAATAYVAAGGALALCPEFHQPALAGT